MNILGINAYHGDASAAMIVDGQLVAAVEEERFTRVKHDTSFPHRSIRYCLDAAGAEHRLIFIRRGKKHRGKMTKTCLKVSCKQIK